MSETNGLDTAAEKEKFYRMTAEELKASLDEDQRMVPRTVLRSDDLAAVDKARAMAEDDRLLQSFLETSVKHVINDSLGQVLAERGARYGKFVDHALITQKLKLVMAETKGWHKLSFSQKEALEMVVHKIGRILNGSPDWADSWVDIAGYAKLVADELNGVSR